MSLSALAAFFLLVAGLAGVAAAPGGGPPVAGGPASERLEAPEGLPPLGDIAAFEAYVKRLRELKKQGVKVKLGFPEAYLWHYKQRAYPFNRFDYGAYLRAAGQRARLPVADVRGSRVFRPGGPRVAQTNRWEFLGPRNMVAPSIFQSGFGEGPASGRVNALEYDPLNPGTYWLAAPTGGVWKTTNSGQTWSYLSQSWPFQQSSSIAVHPLNGNTVLVGTGDFHGFGGYGWGIMKTTDGGATWSIVGANQFTGYAVSRVIIDPDNPDVVLASAGRGPRFLNTGQADGQVWRSTDGGQTWSAVITQTANWSDIDYGPRVGGQRAYYAVAEAGAGGHVWRSTDQGATWTQLTSPMTNTAQSGVDVAVSKTDGNTVYVLAGVDKKVYKSTDGGQNWTDTGAIPNLGNGADGWSQSWYDYYVSTSTAPDAQGNPRDIVYAGLIDLYQSVDGGQNWASIADAYVATAKIHVDQHALTVNPTNPNEALVGCDGGVWRMTFQPGNNSVSFTSLNATLGITEFYRADFHPTDANRMIGGTQDNSTPIARGDLNNWAVVVGGDGAGCQINPNNPNNQYGSSQFQQIDRTDDGWATSRVITPDWDQDRLPFIGRLTLDPSNPNLLYAGSNFLWRYDASTDQWTERLGGQELASGNAVIVAIAVAPSDGNVLYTGSDTGEVWMSRNRGGSWSQINTGGTPLPNRAVTDIVVDPTDPDVIYVTLSGTGSGHLWQLPDALASSREWTDLSGAGAAGLPDIPANTVALDPADPENTMFVGTDVGVFRTTDGGQTWENMNAPLGLPNIQVSSLKVVPGTGYLFAASYGRGIWRIDPGAQQQVVDLTAPNGGEIFLAGDDVEIRWASEGLPAPHFVRLEISRDGGVTWETITAQTVDDGSFTWTSTQPVTDTARIRITSLTDPTISDTSNANFRIVEGSFEVRTPNGGETLRLGERFTLEWEATGFAATAPRVRIELSRDEGDTWTTLFAATPNDGREPWTVTGEVTDDALLRITPTTLPGFTDTSDDLFRIRVRPQLTLVAPNGGERLRVGDQVEILWNTQGMDGQVRIELSRNGGGAAGNWETIFPDTENDGREVWTVDAPGTTAARLRITALDEPGVSDLSNGLFRITAPTLEVVAPVQGHTTVTGADEIIRWRSTGLDASAQVRVELSENGGRSWRTLEASTANDGSTVWRVSSNPTEAAVIRVTSLDDGTVAISSRFSIRRPDLQVVNPNGGERWFVGNVHDIAWSGTAVGHGTVDIFLSRDSGRKWKRILSGVNNDGAVRWGVRGKVTSRARIRLQWNNNTAVRDDSNRNFRIRRGKPRVRPRR